MEKYEVYRKNIFDILGLWASKSKQLEYQKEVPIARVFAELFCQWDDYFANGFELYKFLSEYEIKYIREFDLLINELSEILPSILPEISEFVKWKEWEILNSKAKRILDEIKY